MAGDNGTQGTEGGDTTETPEEIAAREAQEAADVAAATSGGGDDEVSKLRKEVDVAAATSGGGDDEVSKLRKEAAKYRTERNDLKTRLEAQEAEKLSDGEKLKLAHDEAVASNASLTGENKSLKVQLAAGKAGIHPDLVDSVPSMINWDEIDLEADPKALEKALKQLVKDRPALAGSSGGARTVDQGGRHEQGSTGDMNSILRRAAGRE